MQSIGVQATEIFLDVMERITLSGAPVGATWKTSMNIAAYEEVLHTSSWCGEHHVRCYIHIATKHIECSIDYDYCDCVGAEFFKITE